MAKKPVSKKSMACNKPKRTPSHKTKSHVVKACDKGKEVVIRFGQQGVKGAGKKPKTAAEKAQAPWLTPPKDNSSPGSAPSRTACKAGVSRSLAKVAEGSGWARLKIRRGNMGQAREGVKRSALKKIKKRLNRRLTGRNGMPSVPPQTVCAG